MADIRYVHEKVSAAVDCLCVGDGPFRERLFYAWASGLDRLNSNDATAEIAEDLNSVLLFYENKMSKGWQSVVFTDEERFRVSSQLVRLLIETSRLTKRND